jgi:hypothetical protein
MTMPARNYRLRLGRHHGQPGWFVESDQPAAGAGTERDLSAADLPHTVVLPLRTYFVPVNGTDEDELRDRIERCLGEAEQVTVSGVGLAPGCRGGRVD